MQYSNRLVLLIVASAALGCDTKPPINESASAKEASSKRGEVSDLPLGPYQALKLSERRERFRGILKGVQAVDARVWVGYDQRILLDGGMLESQIRERVESRFFLELRKLGIQIDEKASNVLSCNLALNYTGGQLAFSKEVRFEEFVVVPRIGDTKQVTLFESPYIGQIEFQKLNALADNTGLTCAEDFGSQWLADKK